MQNIVRKKSETVCFTQCESSYKDAVCHIIQSPFYEHIQDKISSSSKTKNSCNFTKKLNYIIFIKHIL